MPEGHDRSVDITFQVPFVHRLRVTNDVAGDDFALLDAVLEKGELSTAKVLLIAERPVASASSRVAQLQTRLQESANIDLVRDVMLVDGGESVKNSDTLVDTVLESINSHHLDRRSYIVAVGGGAMLDAVGYAAAIAHRGIRLVRLPTTTLAQADSGVGVKNAINRFDKKNWVGTFAVPWAVINDAGLLETLSDRDFHSGFSEAVKVALLKDKDEFDWLCNHATDIRQRIPDTCNRAIDRSCRLHLKHITEGGDPFEMLEARPLDFGHWSAHRLEPLTNYEIRHGEAVAIGVAIDCIYSSIKFGFPQLAVQQVLQTMNDMGLHLWHNELHPIDRLLGGLEEFRQHLGGRLTITMLRDVGSPVDVHEIDQHAMKTAIEKLHEFCERG